MSTGYVIPVDPAELAARYSTSHDPRFDREDEPLELDEAANVSTEAVAEFFADNDYESRVAPLLDRIPDKEADLIYLYFIQRKRQLDIATIFGITQAAVSYRLERGIQRIKFLLSIPQITEEELRADLPEIFPTRLPCPLCCEAKARAAWSDPGENAQGDSARKKPKKKAKESPYRVAAGPCRVCNGDRAIYIDVAILVGMWQTTCQSEVAETLGLTQGRVRHRFFRAVEVLQAAAAADAKFEPYHKVFDAIAMGKAFNILREVKLPQWADRGQDECF